MSHRRLAPQSREQPRLWLWQTQITPAIELSRPVCARKWRAAASELKEQREDMNFPEVYFSPFFSFTLSTTAQRSNQSAESECFVALQGDVNKEKEASCQAWLPVLWLWWQIDGRQGANGAYILRRWGTSSMSALKAETVASTCARNMLMLITVAQCGHNTWIRSLQCLVSGRQLIFTP